MRIKKSYLKISLLILVLLFAIINYVFINPYSRSNTRRRKKIDVSDKSNWAADWDNSGQFSQHFLKDPVVNQYEFKFIHASEKACLNKSVDILVAMQSSVISFDIRRLARRAWSTQQSFRIIYVFFTGKAGDLDGLQNRIDYEAKGYGDLVQADIHDSAQNLSLISMSMLKWVAIYCPNARFVVKKVEDNWVDFPSIFQALRQKEIDYKHFIMGNSALVVQTPLQHAIHYHYKSIFEYNDSPFTLFAREPVYGFTARTAMVLFHATLRTKLFWKEDVFITGMAAHRARVAVFFDYSFVYK
ncbi:unnamed protein product [Candidula unifasciata]|uniref:Hexosyltransferase n=1 Tax=Candidula unifasciata TaxID=100452 RepID=A0A8S4A171_9EUPU|nr:unnamed protein product [Candidula unifasciata]